MPGRAPLPLLPLPLSLGLEAQAETGTQAPGDQISMVPLGAQGGREVMEEASRGDQLLQL